MFLIGHRTLFLPKNSNSRQGQAVVAYKQRVFFSADDIKSTYKNNVLFVLFYTAILSPMSKSVFIIGMSVCVASGIVVLRG